MPVGVRVILAQTPTLVIAVVGMVAFPNGLRFEVLIQDRDDTLDDPMMRMMHHHGMEIVDDAGQLHPWVLRLGVEFADGSRATNLEPGPMFGDPDRPDTTPEPPVLMDGGGGGGGGHWSRRCWLWPLPPPPSLVFVCEWPAVHVSESRVSVDTEPIRLAAEQTIRLWDDDPDPPATESAWTAYPGG